MQNILSAGYVLKTGECEYRIIDVIGKGASCTAYSAERAANGIVTGCILKEYRPSDSDITKAGKQRFIDSGRMQNQIRSHSCLTNMTPPVISIFEANETAYIDVSCFSGSTLEKLCGLSLTEYMKICRTVADTVKYYHREGYICLDLKPENIFIMQNSPDDTVTQIVEFIDFDSVKEASSSFSRGVSYTRAWAAPELINSYGAAGITKSADIYTVGEIVFYYLFGRHSDDTEHRGFSKYPFEKCVGYEKFIARPDIRRMFTEFFRNTLRSSAANRFSDMESVVSLLDRIISELEKKEFIIPIFPAVTPDFAGRDNELKTISESLGRNNVLFINGIGGIGKSTLVRKYIQSKKSEYDVIIYLEYDGNIKRTLTDDTQLAISTVYRYGGEDTDEYFERKLRCIRNICRGKKTLFVIDNYTDKVTKELDSIFSSGYDTVVVTRRAIPKNSYPVMTVGAIADRTYLYRLISLNLGREIGGDEKPYLTK